METRVVLIAIVVSNPDSVEELNKTLHEFSNFIIGRMGLPYRKDDISLISIALDAPLDEINSLTGKLGQIEGVNAKAVFPKN